MHWKRKKKSKLEIKIDFDKERGEIFIVCEPPDTRPTELIQVLIYAINTINIALKKELEKTQIPKKSKKKYHYIG